MSARRAALAVLGALLLLVAGTTAAPPAAGQEEDDGARLRLGATTPPVAPGGDLTLRLSIEGADDLAALAVRVGLHRCICDRGRSAFTRAVDGEGLGAPYRERSYPVDGLPVAPDGDRVLTVPADDLGLVDAARVYPVTVSLDGPEGEQDSLITFLVRLPDAATDEAPPLWVAWVQPLAAPPALRPDPAAPVDLGDEREELAALASVLAASPVPATLDATPETLEALRELDEGVDRPLRRAGRDRSALAAPYVRVDVDDLVDAGLAEEVGLQRQRGGAVLDEALPRAERDNRTWVLGESTDAAGIAALRAVFVDRLVLREELLEPLEDTPVLTATAPFLVDDGAGGELTAAAVDPGLEDHLRLAADPVLAADHLLADLAVLYLDAPGFDQRGVVVRPPTDSPDRRLTRAVLDGIERHPLLQGVTLERYFSGVDPGEDDGEPVVRTLVEPDGSTDAPDAGELAELRASVASVESALTQRGGTADRIRRLLLVASARDLSEDRRDAYLGAAAGTLEDRGSSVRVVDPGGFRLTAQEGTIPLTVTVDDPPLRVRLELASDKLDFLGGGEGTSPSPGRYVLEDLALDDEETPLEVRVRARTPGAFPMRVRASSPDGEFGLGEGQVTVRATAPSGLGVILSGGAGLFLLVWWAGHWRTVRRQRRLVAR